MDEDFDYGAGDELTEARIEGNAARAQVVALCRPGADTQQIEAAGQVIPRQLYRVL